VLFAPKDGMLRKIVNILAIPNLLLVLAVGAVVAYLGIKGTLNSQSIKAAVAAVTSRPSGADAAASRPAAASQPGTSRASGLLAAEPGSEVAAAGELEMFRRQVANEQAMAEAARLQVLREREKMEQQHKQWEAGRQKELESAQQSGVQKELDILSGIKASQALSVLRGKPEAEAARTLLAMETRKARKIIETCKTAEETDWRKRILELIRQQNNIQAAALAGG
jgi:flagellar motility protein MotE (MotC chaperone)